MARADDLRAELELLELQERYAEAKAAGASKEDLRALGLREARQVFRAAREGDDPGTARPEPFQASARVKRAGDDG